MAASHPFLTRSMLLLLCTVMLAAAPAHAFTADSLDISIDKNGDATAVFRFTLEGLIENAIPQSMLEEQLVNGLASGSEPPTLVSMDRSSATLLIKKFANTYDVPTGTEYRTASMNFKKAQIALEQSALSSVVTADFSPSTIKITFADKFERSFSSSDILPSVTHIIVDPAKAAAAAAAAQSSGSATPTPPSDNGAIKVISSPDGVMVTLDGQVIGTAPDTFMDIPAGSHTLLFTKENYQPVSKTITVKAGQTVQLSVFLSYIEPTQAEQAPGFAGILAAGAFSIALVLRLRR